MEISLRGMSIPQPNSGQAADGAIISRCKNRDAEAFGLLVDRYQARVFGFVRRMVHNVEDAEDIAQEVFVRAFQNIDRFDGRASLTTWLFKIASNLCIDRVRRKDRRPDTVSMANSEEGESVEIEVPDERWNPEVMTTISYMEQKLEEAIGKMSDKLRSVLLLHDIEELSYDEISKVIGIPVGTVKSRLFLARTALQDSIKEFIREGTTT